MNDTFALKLGMERSLEHEPLTAPGGFPASDEERGEVVGFYAVGVLKDDSRTFVAMGRKEVESIRDGSRGYQAAKKYKKESVWDTDFVAMGLKTVIRRICKFLPKSPELATALAMDEKAHAGQGQNLNLNDVIDGSYAPVDVVDEAVEIKEKVPVKTESQMQSVKEPSKLEKLDKVVAALKSASTVEALDEVYIRAEVDLEDAELEVALREYRQCKDAITEQGSLV
jgi:recombination protein RecT